MTWEISKYRLPPEWLGLAVGLSEIHVKGAPPGFLPVSSLEPGSKGKIAYFQRDELEAASGEPLYADVVDESTRRVLIRLGWTPPEGQR